MHKSKLHFDDFVSQNKPDEKNVSYDELNDVVDLSEEEIVEDIKQETLFDIKEEPEEVEEKPKETKKKTDKQTSLFNF